MATLTLPGRFNGPPTTANGGYAAGRLAAFVDADTVAVRLRLPPRLDAELAVRRDGAAAELVDGDDLVARAEPASLPAAAPAVDGAASEHSAVDRATVGLPDAPSLDAARAAAAARGPRTAHPFPTCFGCGPARPPGESVAALLGPLPGGTAWAGSWTPTAQLPHDGATVAREMVWVALDCPSAQPIAPDDGPPHVLGTFTVRLLAPVALDIEHVLLAWPIGERDGRKQRSGSAILRADGTPCARAEALWIALAEPV